MEILDLTKILKDCPKGTMLYSPIFGEVTFQGITDNVRSLIEVKCSDDTSGLFMRDGRLFYHNEDAECMLFPSKDCRDWSTFNVEQPKVEPKFKPFDRVLVRNGDNYYWEIDFFDHYTESKNFPYRGLSSGWRKYCIPYEGNEHLCGTNDEPMTNQRR